MAETPQSIQASMNAVIAGLQKQLDALTADMFLILPNGIAKYTESELDELNNVRAKLGHEIFHRQVKAAFQAASVTVVKQPTQAEVDALKATLVELGKPLTLMANAFAVVGFLEDLMTQSAKQLNALRATVKP